MEQQIHQHRYYPGAQNGCKRIFFSHEEIYCILALLSKNKKRGKRRVYVSCLILSLFPLFGLSAILVHPYRCIFADVAKYQMVNLKRLVEASSLLTVLVFCITKVQYKAKYQRFHSCAKLRIVITEFGLRLVQHRNPYS